MKALILFIAVVAVLSLLLPYVIFRQPPMPPGTDLSSPPMPYTHAELLIDRSYRDPESGKLVTAHEIFSSVTDMIAGAEGFILLDFFLWNPWKGAIESDGELQELSSQLAEALIRKRRANPELPILAITDPINRIYGDHAPAFFDRLAAADIPVVFTDLSRLPDSNALYAPPARLWGPLLSKLMPGAWQGGRHLGNPFDAGGARLSLAQFFKLLYFKANHRKVLVTGAADGSVEVLLCSFNPADGSANHSNIGLRVDGPVAVYAARSELAIAEWSMAGTDPVHAGRRALALDAIEAIQESLRAISGAGLAEEDTAPTVAWRSEAAIRDELLLRLEGTGTGDEIRIAVFYLSDRRVVRAIKAAARRGARVRLILDANRDAFGMKKNGIPNRPVAAELMALSDRHAVEVRWAATHGEQFHSKALRISGEGKDLLFLGSANWTRRNIGNFNLEANLLLEKAGSLGAEFDHYFDTLWQNGDGYKETLPYGELADSGFSLLWKKILYHLQEASGASTF